MEEGVATTEIPVTVDGAAIVTVAVPYLLESCVEVALTVSDPEPGTVSGAV
jgi:hypothetical protein